MSEWKPRVVQIGAVAPHPNADALDVTDVEGYPVVCKRGEWKEGDLAAYLPIDTIVPDIDEWRWLAPADHEGPVPERTRTIKAKKLRGVFSMGLLWRVPEAPEPAFGWAVGADVTADMGLKKREEPEFVTGGHKSGPNPGGGGETEPAPKGWMFPCYTDLDSLRKYRKLIAEGERVICTEKIHGANGRYVHDGERLWVGSRTQIKAPDAKNQWWRVASSLDLDKRLAEVPMHVFFGEVFGQVQDLKYGIATGYDFRCFDVFDVKSGRYLDYDAARAMAERVGLPWVPVLHDGPWSPELEDALAEGKTTLGAGHVREGFVLRPAVERWNERCGRVIFKRHGQGYLLRKGA